MIQRVDLRRESEEPRALLQVHECVVSLRIPADACEPPAKLNRLFDVVVVLVDPLLLVVLPVKPRCGREQKPGAEKTYSCPSSPYSHELPQHVRLSHAFPLRC